MCELQQQCNLLFFFRWILNSKQKHSLTFILFLLDSCEGWQRLHLMLMKNCENIRNIIKFPTGLLWHLCILMIPSPCPSLLNGKARQYFACLFTMKIHTLFCRRHLFLQKTGISPVSWSLTSACTAVKVGIIILLYMGWLLMSITMGYIKGNLPRSKSEFNFLTSTVIFC